MLPRSLWSELSQAELSQVILHEMAHLDRGDDWTNLVQKLLRSLCPLNPALVWAERELCREREQACDDAVLDAAGNAREYATCLTRLAESRLVRRAAALAPGLWKRPSELAARVDNILHRRRTLTPLFSRGLVAASLVFSLSGALALQRCPGLISFAAKDAMPVASVAPRAESSTAAYVPARYEDHMQPRFQNAVFYPPVTHQPVNPVKRVAKTHNRKVRPAPKARNFKLIEMSQQMTQEMSQEHLTLIVFTVDIPQDSGLPAISITSNWIEFQI